MVAHPGPGTAGRPSARRASPRTRAVVDRIPFLDKELFLLEDLLPSGGVAVDVGAAGGVHTLLASRLVGPDGRVVAIEARPGSVRILRAWRRVLGLDNVQVLSTAVGAAPGSLDLRVPLVPTRSHAAGGDDGSLLARLPAATRTVGMTTLDLVATAQGLQRLDLVKVDVEGAELDVLEGGEATIGIHRPVLLVEVVDAWLRRSGHSAADLFAWLKERDYHALRFTDDGLVEVTAADPTEHNYLFLPD